MITTHFSLCALPEIYWHQEVSLRGQKIDIHTLVDDALGVERRLAKGVNQQSERARYSLCCARIESAISPSLLAPVSNGDLGAVLKSERLPVTWLGPEYLDVLAQMVQKKPVEAAQIRVAASFFPPDAVQAHIRSFQQLATDLGLDSSAVRQRAAFFQAAAQNRCGVIELQNAFEFSEAPGSEQPARAEPIARPRPPLELEEEFIDRDGDDLLDILREQISSALGNARNGQAGIVNFSNQPHSVITEALHQFAYSESGRVQKPTYIQVVYTDGSQGAAFPLLCLPRRSASELDDLRAGPQLRAALLSMRHLAMDREVDMSWFRNREVSKSRSLAETDAFCYAESVRQLRESRSVKALRILLYQTGFQPAVIGFYRALVEELLWRAGSAPSLEVTPYYFRPQGSYRKGETWR